MPLVFTSDIKELKLVTKSFENTKYIKLYSMEYETNITICDAYMEIQCVAVAL